MAIGGLGLGVASFGPVVAGCDEFSARDQPMVLPRVWIPAFAGMTVGESLKALHVLAPALMRVAGQ
jgi:hypothetical protein